MLSRVRYAGEMLNLDLGRQGLKPMNTALGQAALV